MKVGIIQFPGSNCERETMLAVKRVNMEPVPFLWNESREKLQEMDGYVIIGGFSYEDRSRAGIIAALDPVMHELKAQSEQGKPILGICNGAQILVETGLVPGLENNKVGLALTENKRVVAEKVLGTGYYNAWVNLRLSDEYQRNAFTRHLTTSDVLHVPIAHAEGRFILTEALLQEIKAQGLNVFQYCDPQGNIEDSFPINPNGSVDNIAAISNKAGNVLAMMPHPERTTNGDAIFRSMRDYIAEQNKQRGETVPLYYYPRQHEIPRYQKPTKSYECVVELMITDNHARTVQNTLHQLGIFADIKRLLHWEIECESEEMLEQIKATGIIYNNRKEKEVHLKEIKEGSLFLVRAKEDLLGQQKLQTLKDHFSIHGVSTIRRGVLWQFFTKECKIADLKDQILKTNILFNSYAHDCYHYNTLS